MNVNKIRKIIDSAYNIAYIREAKEQIENLLEELESFVNENHFLLGSDYLLEIEDIFESVKEMSSFSSMEDRIHQKSIQKDIANLARKILEENKKIFIVHGRNIPMRDKVSSFLGRLKLDYVILESEHNSGATIIEKFINNAEDCLYAIVLFSADDLGKLENSESDFQSRVRQNVILELGYFLGKVGRRNIVILHEVNKNIETPSDFSGIVYEPFDEYGAWKSKLIREMRNAQIYIKPELADRV